MIAKNNWSGLKWYFFLSCVCADNLLYSLFALFVGTCEYKIGSEIHLGVVTFPFHSEYKTCL